MINIKLSKEINRTAEECWKVFGGGYADIYKWKPSISSSIAEGEPFGDASCGSRKITTSGITFSEKLVHFSNAERAFTYEVIGLPFVIASARNKWHFSESNGKATLHMNLQMHISKGFGWLLKGLLASKMETELEVLLNDFKQYMEKQIATD